MAQAADSNRSFNAQFISSKPRLVSPSSIVERNGQSKPPNRSRWMNRTRPSPKRLYRERMLAVEQSGHPEMTEPPEFPVGIDHQHGGADDIPLPPEGWM